MILRLWRDVREAYHDAVRQWVAGDKGGTILFLGLAIRRTETLIYALKKGVTNGKNSNR